MSIKRKIFNLVDPSSKNKSAWSRSFDILIISLIFLSTIGIILESYKDIHSLHKEKFKYFEYFTVIIFTIEYVLRVWTADLKYPEKNKVNARLKFIFSKMGLIDLMAILPFYLPFICSFDMRFIRILRVFRLFRLFKLNRYTSALKLVGEIFYEKRTELGLTVFVTVLLLLISSTLMYNIEHDIQPEQFPNIIATLWWAIATLTTVGYGDVYPITGMGQFISGIIAFLGIGMVALPAGIISAGFIEKVEMAKKDQTPISFCPHCGKEVHGKIE